MGDEYRIYGPPGTGKTTWTAERIKSAAKKFGSAAVLAGSFTRAGAEELKERDLPIDDDQVGTLHSHCLAALGFPKLIGKDDLKDWNERHPNLAVTRYGKQSSIDGGMTGLPSSAGDMLLSQAEYCRAVMMLPENWPSNVARFYDEWTRWKLSLDVLDFTDLIEHCLLEKRRPPGAARVAIWDEAQDFSILELRLVRQWSEMLDHTYLIGDDDQCLYTFKGASAQAFLTPELPDRHNVILSQSYRVPQAVQAFAERIVRQVQTRFPKKYRPREAAGAVHRFPSDYRNVGRLVQALLAIGEAEKTAMVIAPCAYMISPLVEALKEQGILFHNPFAPTRGDWNPLRRGSKDRTTVLDRIAAYLRQNVDLHGEDARTWTAGDVIDWSKDLRLKRGFKKWLSEQSPVAPMEPWDLEQWFTEADLAALYASDIRWFASHLLSSRQAVYQNALTILARSPKKLFEAPRIIVGTIHSVKGAEADVVFFVPDLSVAGYQEYQQRGEHRDAVLRMFYVAATRAREDLNILRPATRLHWWS